MNKVLKKKKPSELITSGLKLFIIMGVSGSGKTVIGKKLAKELNKKSDFEFIDADDFHSTKAKQQMAANIPLNDAMRKPWIEAIIVKLNDLNKQNKNVVLAFSGLKKKHRECFRILNFHCHYYYLFADIKTIRSRMTTRKNHFFSAELLASQFRSMEEVESDENDITKLDISSTFDEVYKHLDTLTLLELNKEP